MQKEMQTLTLGNCTFTLDSRYQFIKVIGRGAYGTVIACKDTLTGQDVAIKKVTRAFTDPTDAKRLLRELMLLRHLRHENTVRLLDVIQPGSGPSDFEDVYMVMELMETDLHRIINSRQPLTDEHIQFFIFQVLKALKYIHSAGVLHRDLKPSNLLVNSSCDLKVCDFGLARGTSEDDVVLTEYVVTRWYRAPEVMLSSKSYASKVDVWSAGCILAELLLRRPLFQGDDYIHQLHLIFELLGTPDVEDMECITSEKAKRFVSSLQPRPAVSLAPFFPPGTNPQAVDLIQKMLTFNPDKRISVEEALLHPYLSDFEGEEAKVCDAPFEYPSEAQTIENLRELVWKEILHYDQHKTTAPVGGASSSSSAAVQDAANDGTMSNSASRVSDASRNPVEEHPNGVAQDEQTGGGLRKRLRRPEDTMTPMKTHMHEASLFAQLSASAETEGKN